jgi:hemolysin III
LSSTRASGVEVALEAAPRLRGVSHAAGLGLACVVGAFFVAATDGIRALAAGVFAASVVAMLAASALYHRIDWSPRVRPWVRRLDHAAIYVLIAGTYTCVGLVSLDGHLQRAVLAVVWVAAAVAALTRMCWIRAPDWLSVAFGIALGWVGLAALPQLLDEVGVAGVALLAAGGIAYTGGGLVYAWRRPDPVPSVFGYHEVFHALTLVALALQYSAIAFFVVDVA